jgi:drug/metabolite transporter (DMT)-like permease
MSTASVPVPAYARVSGLIALVAIEAALVVCWSAGFVGVRFALEQAPLFRILLWRSLVSGLLLLPFALALGPRLRWRSVLPQFLFGAVSMAGYLAAFALAIAHGVPTGLVALITDMLPLMVALLSWPLLGQALGRGQWAGIAIGVIGVVIASLPGLSHASDGMRAPLWAYGLPLLGMLVLAVGMLLQKRAGLVAMPVYQALCIQCLAAAAVFAGFAWGEGGLLPVLAPGFAIGILWLVFLATFGAWGLYYLALRTSSPTRVTAVLYLSPPVTMLWAWAMFGEPLSWEMALGLCVSLAGVIMVARVKRRGPE